MFNDDYIDRILYFELFEVNMFWWFVWLIIIYLAAIIIIDIIDEIIKIKEKKGRR